MKKLILGLLAAGVLVAANAQDKTLLETLVKKGVLTQQEAAQIAKDTVTVSPGNANTKSIKLFGGASGWYAFNKDSVKAPGGTPSTQTSTFLLRYVKLGIEADVGGGWTATLVTDFGTEGANRNYLDKVVLSKTIDVDYLTGRLDLGFRKVNMGYEQTTDDFQQLAIERSIATWFFTRPDGNGSLQNNFGSRTTGIFWEGTVAQCEGLYYSVAVTSNIDESDPTSASNDGLSFWAAVGYKMALNEGVLDMGCNFGYAPRGAFSLTNGAIGSTWGINPYAAFTYKGLTVIGEFFLQQVENYSYRNGVGQTPLGANLTVAYKMDIGDWGAIEPVVRGSYVASNGMGVGNGTANNVLGNGTGALFDNAAAVYVGANWYITNAIKTSVGYEFGYYTGSIFQSDESRMYSNTILAQVQVLF